MRLYLPGEECLGKLVAGVAAPDPAATAVAAPPEIDPATGEPIPTAPTVPPTAPPPVVKGVDSGTTVAPNVLDPLAPIPTVDPKAFVVYTCARGANAAKIGGG